MERGPRDAEFKHRCYPKARDLAAFFLFRPEAPTFFFLGAFLAILSASTSSS